MGTLSAFGGKWDLEMVLRPLTGQLAALGFWKEYVLLLFMDWLNDMLEGFGARGDIGM